jgi:hypothetical protein
MRREIKRNRQGIISMYEIIANQAQLASSVKDGVTEGSGGKSR